MSKYKVSAGDCGKWALVSEATGKVAILFETFERAASFVSQLPASDRSSIDVTAVEALQPPPHVLAGEPARVLAIPVPDGHRITCPQCGAQYIYVPQAEATQVSTSPSDEDVGS